MKIPCGTAASASCPNPAINWTVQHTGNGNYVGTITGFTAPPVDGTVFMLSAMNPIGVTATAVATYGTATHDVVGDQACINCHGNHVWRGANHDVTSPQGVGPCIVCHNRKGAADPRLPGAGSGLMGIVHGIHNSKNMPDAQYTFTWTNGNQLNFSIGFPGYMNNCSTCHDSETRLAAANNAPVSYALCMSCHDDWDGFANTVATGIRRSSVAESSSRARGRRRPRAFFFPVLRACAPRHFAFSSSSIALLAASSPFV